MGFNHKLLYVKTANRASFPRKQQKMANPSPSTLAIDSIAQCLANAAEAARGLNCAASQDLCSLLQIAACEAERVRKAIRKAAPKKAAAKADKKSTKRQRVSETKVAPQQARSRRKVAATANGVAAH